MERDPLPGRMIADVPPLAPLPQIENTAFESTLETATHALHNDFKSGASQLADVALACFTQLTDAAVPLAVSQGDLWSLLVYAARRLSAARPSMGAAVTARLLYALKRIAECWKAANIDEQSLAAAAKWASDVLGDIKVERLTIGTRLSLSFVGWLLERQKEHLHRCGERLTSIRILTLSNSKSICEAMIHALSDLPDMQIRLTVLESRPRCEGADMASWIYTRTLHKSRLSVIIMPDCAVATAVQNIDIVLLGADCINPNGNVSNKMGSLAAALCAKQQNQNVSVVVLSDTEKIAVLGEGMEGHEIHPSSELSTAWTPETRGALEDNEHVQIFGEWFEWVPAELVDVYVTERGRLTARDVANLANEVKELKEGIFQTEEE